MRLIRPMLRRFCADKKRLPLKISLIYALFGVLWIFLSDSLLEFVFTDPHWHYRGQTLKGWIFVLVSAGLLFGVIEHYRRALFRTEESLDELVQGVSAATGEAFFSLLTQSLCQALKADYAFIGELTGENNSRVRTVAVYSPEAEVENFEFVLAGTPCEQVVSRGLVSLPADVGAHFPADSLATKLGVTSYVGIPLFDAEGRVIGPMVVLSRRPLEDQNLAVKMLKVFSLRAAAELQRARSEKTIEYMAFYDPLTGLANKRLFLDRLEHALPQARRAQRFPAVLFLDLDRFRNVNDTLGHAAGDQLLKEVGRRLQLTLRKDDTVARLGGDEFLILLPNIRQAEDAAQVAEKIIAALRLPFDIHGFELHLAASIGIAIFPFDGETTDGLLKNADTALNRAKELGRNNFQFYLAEMNESSLSRLGLESQLRKALERGELRLHFQPQYEVAGTMLVGLEALLRWEHPERGMVSPAEFIPLAEETGLIVPMGEWVLRQACAQNRAWQLAGFAPLRVAVNISARQFHQYDLVRLVRNVLAETGLDPQWLELEITESLIMQDSQGAVQKLSQLRELGVQIAIDDFGTGYSSLSYLKKFPIQTLKIDRSFVKDLSRNRDDAAIVDAVIALAHSLGMDVVAEGVETVDQLHLLHGKKCNRVQGFFFHPPLPGEAVTLLLEKLSTARDEGESSLLCSAL
ncbi:putative bifunctional diguanylate cyclase/phosphodiesterase [Geoalkalibacter sp.]|uniref:putative bifunctional diguanylate cyclase/phosphodiesterase n=1 Tax=Geoalkalibacter sp. TaxID=3041440 RepID=UPI00272E043B|nr:EAL domain-containing protein [Geoalkalibacter sp.]